MPSGQRIGESIAGLGKRFGGLVDGRTGFTSWVGGRATVEKRRFALIGGFWRGKTEVGGFCQGGMNGNFCDSIAASGGLSMPPNDATRASLLFLSVCTPLGTLIARGACEHGRLSFRPPAELSPIARARSRCVRAARTNQIDDAERLSLRARHPRPLTDSQQRQPSC